MTGTTFPKLYYFNVLAELARTKESAAVALVQAMNILFHQLAHMDVMGQTVFVEW